MQSVFKTQITNVTNLCSREARRMIHEVTQALPRFMQKDWGESPMSNANTSNVDTKRDGSYIIGKYGTIVISAELVVIGDDLHLKNLDIRTSKEVGRFSSPLPVPVTA